MEADNKRLEEQRKKIFEKKQKKVLLEKQNFQK
jgi:hypothetical protein